jgi:hypothetical protein
MASARIERLMPWGGLVAGALALALQQQILADLLHYVCTDERALGLAIGAGAALLTIAGGAASYRAMRASSATLDIGARRFVAKLSLIAAAFFLFAIALQTAAAVLAPPCGA